MNLKRYVCFEDDGTIYKVTNKPDERFKNLELDFAEVEDFITGKLSLLEHKVEFDFLEKKYSIKSLKQVDDEKLMWAFLYEIPKEKPDENQIIITKDNIKKCWRVKVDEKFAQGLQQQNIEINLQNYYFSVTKKDDPNVLYKLLQFPDSLEVAFENNFEFDNEEISVYTMRRFDTYYYEEVND